MAQNDFEYGEMKLNQEEKKEIENSKNVKLVLNLLDKLVAGKRFGESDSAKQVWLLDCQAKIDDMRRGWYTENSLEFLHQSIDELMCILTAAGMELDNIFKKEENKNESND